VVRSTGRWPSLLVAASVSWVAGCAPTTQPPASPRPPSLTSSALAGATSEPSPSPTDTPGLADEIEVGRLDPELTDTILEFASDGTSILFSSGLADDAGANAAPDLWRVEAGADGRPELLWRNPARDHSIVKLAGDLGMVAFVDIPLDGTRAWDLWLIPRHDDEAILLDTHPGPDKVSGLVPSFSVQEQTIVWTAFDIGPDGPVSQMLMARAPDWEPTLLLERAAAGRELWFPSLYGPRVAFCEVVYSADRTTDQRHVYLLDLGDAESEPVRLDHSDLATMPILVEDTVIWKEADPGFSMFNWGLLWRDDIGGPGPMRLDTAPVDYVDNPSAGSRFVAWAAADSFQFVVYDLLENRPRVIESYSAADQANVLRPHIAWDLLVWLYAEGETADGYAEIRYAFLPPVRSPP
jgi:hypothetical protein